MLNMLSVGASVLWVPAFAGTTSLFFFVRIFRWGGGDGIFLFRPRA
jgi:hypothetical protein